MNKKILFLLIISFSTHAIKLDGILDDEQWQKAQHFDKMILVNPYVLSKAQYQTDILVVSDEKGIYFGIKNFQPLATRNTDKSARDQRIGSDRNQIIIDFDNNGIAAYSFEIGVSGSIRDGIFSNENNFSNEWDGNWSAKTSSTKDYWVSEVFIPWDVVSMKKTETDMRKLKWYVSRTVVDINEVYANVPADNSRQRFMSEFSTINVKDYATSSFSLFGYATGRRDFHKQIDSSGLGLDLFWKSGDGKQLTAAINPDFGQIESDRLVVNFSATEIFFNERRPFFTENQSMFNVVGTFGLRVLHTRRIGGRPDSGTGLASDIDAAVKFTDSRDKFSYGLFAVTESSGNDYQGRDYYAGRFLHKTDNQTIGYTTTFVDRPDIDRTAFTNTINHEYFWNDNIVQQSQLINTDTNENNDKQNDWGGWTSLSQQLTENQQHAIILAHYGRDFEINDFGFLPRNSLNSLFYSHNLKQTNQSFDYLQQREYLFTIEHRNNDSGDKLGTTFTLSDSWQFKDSSSFSWDIKFYSVGVNDLISRGNGLVNTDSGNRLGVSYRSSNVNKFRYHGFLRRIDKFDVGTEYATHLHPSYFFTDDYSLSLSIFYRDSSDWLNWIGGDKFGRYKRKLLNTSLDFNANISPKQELRMRFQWLAINAQANREYQLNSSANLIKTNPPLNDFSLSNTALQIRYRYEIAPLSNIYVVYSRGGQIFEENSNSLGSLFDPGLSNVTGNNFLIKIRYKFF